jgi:hypothetical protein
MFICPVFRRECLQKDCTSFSLNKSIGFYDIKHKNWVGKYHINSLKLPKNQTRVIRQIEEHHLCSFVNKEIFDNTIKDFKVE